MVFQNDILAGASGTAAGYTIDQSIRFNDNDTASLYKTFASAGDRRTWTLSLWFKRGNLTRGAIFSAGSSNSNIIRLQLQNTDVLNAGDLVVPTDFLNWNSDAVYRDTSAWYHVVFRWDTTEATAADRFRVYINGVQQTPDPGIIPAQNYEGRVNQAVKHEFGRSSMGTDYIYDGYMAEINFIDGQALDPTNFGEYNDDGVWIPKAYEGTYGTNGFYITGADSADLGADESGNGNDFTSSGLTSDDQRGDTPTTNHATWNPLFFRRTGSYKPTFADGNLYVAGQSSQVSHTGTTISSTGKHYAEFLLGGTSSITGPGVVRALWDGGLAQSYASNYGGSYYGSTGNRNYNATNDSQTAPGSDRVGIEVDFANNEVEYFIVTSGGTRTSQGGKLTAADGIAFDGEGIFTATLHDTSSRNVTAYFEEADWYGTPNAGYKAMSTANLPTPAITDGSTNFNIVQYTGTGNVTRSVTGVGFQPDLVLNKQRNNTSANVIANAVSGANTFMATEQTAAETSFTNSIYGYLSSFDSDGYTLTPGSTNNNYWNESGKNVVSYNWLAGNGTASNTDGDISSTVSVNATAGISLLTYTGNGSAAQTVGHGLGVTPTTVLVKPRTASDNWLINNWATGVTAFSEKLKLNSNEAASSTGTSQVYAGNSTTFTIGTDPNVNGSGTEFLAVAFVGIPGYSHFTSYKGNGSSNGPYIHLNHKSRFFFIKEESSADDWVVYDTARDTYNVAGQVWRFDSNAAEFDGRSSSRAVDILSNGLKIRSSNGTINGSGVTYIVGSWAEHPFGGDGVAPVPAR